MKTLLHGSQVPLKPGDYLLPAQALGLPTRIKTANQPRYSPPFVYVTEREDYARVFGTVYEVEPVGPLYRDPDAKQAWRCRRARVVAVRAAP